MDSSLASFSRPDCRKLGLHSSSLFARGNRDSRRTLALDFILDLFGGGNRRGSGM